MTLSPVFFKIGSLEIYYYGIIMAVAVVAGLLISDYFRKKYYSDVTENAFFDTLFLTIIFGFIGARLYYCIVNFQYYALEPLEIFNFRQGGLSIHGGILLGAVAGMTFAKLRKFPVLRLADISVFGLLIAQAIGRWGNYFNSEAFGKPTDIFCKMYVSPEFRPHEYINFEYFHPTFLYESILNICAFLLLAFVVRKLCKNYDGLVFASYLALYSVIRFFVELLRIDSNVFVLGLPLPAVVSVAVLFVSLVIFVAIVFAQNTKND